RYRKTRYNYSANIRKIYGRFEHPSASLQSTFVMKSVLRSKNKKKNTLNSSVQNLLYCVELRHKLIFRCFRQTSIQPFCT
ncbi:hypothetical protein L9F63_027365, partial [Diploptera punctata]